jgi:hypothetical protein
MNGKRKQFGGAEWRCVLRSSHEHAQAICSPYCYLGYFSEHKPSRDRIDSRRGIEPKAGDT